MKFEFGKAGVYIFLKKISYAFKRLWVSCGQPNAKYALQLFVDTFKLTRRRKHD